MWKRRTRRFLHLCWSAPRLSGREIFDAIEEKPGTSLPLIRLSTQHIEQVPQIERLCHELHLGLPVDYACFILAADGDDALRPVQFGQRLAVLQQLKSVHLGHAQVSQQYIKVLRAVVTSAPAWRITRLIAKRVGV